MNILYDYQAFIQKVGGVSRYHCELIKNLPEGFRAVLPYMLSDNVYLRDAGVKQVSLFPAKQPARKEALYKGVDMAMSMLALKQKKYDIFHPTFLNPYYIGRTKKPTVITIHDLLHEKMPDLVVKADIVREKRRKCVEDTDAVICISEETKSDLKKYYEVPDEKIRVIYHGADQDLFVSTSASMYEKPYMLFIGNRKGYKNFQAFLQAFSLLNEDVDLVCTGSAFNSDELQLINRLGVSNRMHQIFASNEEMNELLYHALAFVYPSLGEGFGLPILEAFRCSCPCIVSDLGCFNEVAGDSAVYFNPESIDDMLSVISKTLNDSQRLKTLRASSRQRLKLFTWEKTTRETASLYKSLL